MQEVLRDGVTDSKGVVHKKAATPQGFGHGDTVGDPYKDTAGRPSTR